MSDEDEGCGAPLCTCGGKPPFSVGYSVTVDGIEMVVYVCDQEIEGQKHMVMSSIFVPAEEIPLEVAEAVRTIADYCNITAKEQGPAMVAEIDQRAAAYRSMFNPETPNDPAS